MERLTTREGRDDRARPRSSATSAARRLPLIVLPMAGGAALVTHILLGLSLRAMVALIALVSATAWVDTWRRSDAAYRAELALRLRAGLRGGILGTLAYDAGRYGLVALLAFSFEPFHVWSIFGELVVGKEASSAAKYAAGAAYHASNGIGFAIAFALTFRRPSWKLGIVWGIGLELMMAFFYPAWLRMTALGEFLTVSAFGHVVYGAVMGWTVQRAVFRGHSASGERSA